MSTALQEPANPFQRPGEVCTSCQEFWTSQNLPPKHMVSLGSFTEEKAIEIVVCPHCDGDMILRLKQ